jgi:CheY-like chemotaxis protein
VDDNRMMAKTLQDIFRVKGYEAEVAHSGSEALGKLERSCFNCVLSDIKMPDINGIDLYKAIKTHQPNLPVVLMTAYTADKLVKQGLEEGVIAVLTKPLDPNFLLDFLSSYAKSDPSPSCR